MRCAFTNPPKVERPRRYHTELQALHDSELESATNPLHDVLPELSRGVNRIAYHQASPPSDPDGRSEV